MMQQTRELRCPAGKRDLFALTIVKSKSFQIAARPRPAGHRRSQVIRMISRYPDQIFL